MSRVDYPTGTLYASTRRVDGLGDDPIADLVDYVEDMAAMLALHDGEADGSDLDQLELTGYFDPDNLRSPLITAREARLLAAAWAMEVTRIPNGRELLLSYGGPTIRLQVTSSRVRVVRQWSTDDWAETDCRAAIAVARAWLRRYASIVGRDPQETAA